MQQSAAGKTLTPQQARIMELAPTRLAAVMREEMTWARLQPMVVQIYRENFEQTEVDGLIAFQQSPQGQAVIALGSNLRCAMSVMALQWLTPPRLGLSFWRTAMQITLPRILVSASLLLFALSAAANDPPTNPENFSPYELVGDWQFVNSNSGTKFGGDIKVSVNQLDKPGTMRGTISYDGRQLNDVCGTRGVFSDEPVEAEIIKSKDEYRISFMAKCLRGKSPRLFSWTLVCEGATCTQPTVVPHGRGVLALTEKR